MAVSGTEGVSILRHAGIVSFGGTFGARQDGDEMEASWNVAFASMGRGRREIVCHGGRAAA
jgi:hypothetical protein